MNDARFEEFVYILSHDLSAAPRALRELSQWIVDDIQAADLDLPSEVAESLAMMRQQASRLDQYFADLLTYSRVGRMQEVAVARLDQAVEQAIANLEVPDGYRISHDLGTCALAIGERDVVTLFEAALSNAIKHRAGIGRHTRVSARTDGNTMVLSVSDDGPGIAPKYRQTVWKPFSTLRARDEVEGSGMGLPIIERICSHYGATVRIDGPEEGAGCTLTVRFPAGAEARSN